MKYLCTLLALIFTTGFNWGQTFGIHGGCTFSKLHIQDNSRIISKDYDFLGGYHFGISLEKEFNKGILLELSGDIKLQGYKNKMEHGTWHENLYYINMPLHFKKKITVGKFFLIGGSGPYLSRGIYGKSVYEMNGKKESVEINWGSDENDDYERMDYGIDFMMGLRYQKLNFTILYQHGIANISPYTVNGAKIKNRVLELSLGYYFTKNKRMP